jgi:DNA-binding PadR family transcriptional regulator
VGGLRRLLSSVDYRPSIIAPTRAKIMDRLPVSEFQILLSLLDGEQHGAAIRDDVAARTHGAVLLGPGTLYTSVKRLLARGWIEELATDAGDIRRVYSLTRAGRSAASAEAEALSRDLEHARRHRLIGRLRST